MLHTIGWLLVPVLLLFWSVGVWVVHAVAAWAISQAGATANVATRSEVLHLPQWLAPWVPPEFAQGVNSLIASLAPVMASLLQDAPLLAGGLTTAMWLIWALGVLSLFLLGAGLHLSGLLRRRTSHPSSRWLGQRASR
jgi:hypothetical protein